MVDGPDSAWRNRAPGPHRNTARQAMDGLWTEARGQQKQSNDPRNNQHNPQYANYRAPLTRTRHTMPHPAQPQHTNDWALRTGNDTSKSTGRSGRQNAATRRNMRREERVTVQGPVKEQQPDGMSHRGAVQMVILCLSNGPRPGIGRATGCKTHPFASPHGYMLSHHSQSRSARGEPQGTKRLGSGPWMKSAQHPTPPHSAPQSWDPIQVFVGSKSKTPKRFGILSPRPHKKMEGV